MDQRFLLISFGERNKKIPVVETLTLDLIKGHVRAKFGLENVILQIFDLDVSEYIDLECDDDLVGIEQKVLKIKICKALAHQPSENIENMDDEEQKRRDTPSPLPDTPSSSLSRSLCSSPSLPSACSSPIAQPSTSTFTVNVAQTRTEAKRKPWPRVYNFPSEVAPRALVMKKDQQEPFEKKDRGRLLDTIYNDVTQYEGGLYPSSDMYEQIVDGILKEFPLLLQEGGIPLQSVRVYWKEKLKYKWQNERKSKDRNLPEVMAKKRKSLNNTALELPQAKKNLTWGMINYLPKRPTSEDDTSIKMHQTWLKQEFNKSDQDFRLVDLKMDMTFADRRQRIIKDGIGISELIQEFPFMQDRRQLLMEFLRLGPNTERKELEDLLLLGLDNYLSAIVKLSSSRKMVDFVKQVFEQIQVQRSEDQRKYTSQCAAIFGISLLLKEKLDKLIVFSDDDDAEVQLVIKDQILTMGENKFVLKIDGHNVFSCDTFLELITGLMAAVYCFNLVYPKPIEKTLLFMQNCLMCLNDGGKIDKKIVSVITELNKERAK